jgi:hypothetical protein
MRIAILIFAAFLFAPGAAAKLLRYASQIDPGTMDPHALASVYNNRVLSQIYEPLVDRDEQFKPTGRLALSWAPLEGGKGWRFKLRPGVKFHDGTPFTADDVVFNVSRALDSLSAYKTALPNVTTARKVDELTVDILTSQPTPVLPLQLINLRLMSKAWCEKHHVEKPQDYRGKQETYAARNANGTGAFRLVRWETDVKTVLVRPGVLGQARQRDRSALPGGGIRRDARRRPHLRRDRHRHRPRGAGRDSAAQPARHRGGRDDRNGREFPRLPPHARGLGTAPRAIPSRIRACARRCAPRSTSRR